MNPFHRPLISIGLCLAISIALGVVSGCALSRDQLLQASKPAPASSMPEASRAKIFKSQQSPASKTASGSKTAKQTANDGPEESKDSTGIIQVSAQADGEKRGSSETGFGSRLEVPKTLPGTNAPPLDIPTKDESTPAQRDKRIDEVFPELSPPEDGDLFPRGPESLSLADLEQLALSNSPIIAQYESDINAAVGSSIQAGTHPNPIVGYESDTVGSSSTRDYQGVYASQVIKTAGKLKLAQSIENVDLMNAQVALKAARIDLQTKVRAQYFAVLIAQENLKVTQALAKFTYEVYQIKVEVLKVGEQPAYEAQQLSTFVMQSRSAFAQARNRYTAAWNQLIATLNLDKKPVRLRGNVASAVPLVDFENALSWVLENHTDIVTARNGIMRAQKTLEYNKVVPIPDVFVYATFQKDFTTPGLQRTSYNSQVGLPMPFFDQNKGNIITAQSNLIRATHEVTRVSNDLRMRLNDAYLRYENNRIKAQYYLRNLLPSYTQSYESIYHGHDVDSEKVQFNDVFVAQQTLLNAITDYMTTLMDQWTAVTDVAGLLQLSSLEEMSVQLFGKQANDKAGSHVADANDLAATITRILEKHKNRPEPKSPKPAAARASHKQRETTDDAAASPVAASRSGRRPAVPVAQSDVSSADLDQAPEEADDSALMDDEPQRDDTLAQDELIDAVDGIE